MPYNHMYTNNSLMVHAGDVIEWQQRRGPKKQPAWRTMRQDANIVVVYEDGHFACVIKPPGWATRVRLYVVYCAHIIGLCTVVLRHVLVDIVCCGCMLVLDVGVLYGGYCKVVLYVGIVSAVVV